MKFSFADLHADIDRQKEALEELAKAYADLEPPSFDPSTKTYPGISPLEMTPDLVAFTVITDAADNEAAYQENMVGICLAQMEVANKIIELQLAFATRLKERREIVQQVVNEDNKKFVSLLNASNDLHQQRKNPMLPSTIEEESYEEQMIEITNDNDDINRGKLRYQYRYATQAKNLLENIFELRMEMAILTLAASEEGIRRLSQIIDEFRMLKVAQDERVVDSEELEPYIQATQAHCEATLQPMMGHLQTVEEFLNELKKMGSDPRKIGTYEPDKYLALSINALPTINP